jgi:SAM-dependent methyltransferase
MDQSKSVLCPVCKSMNHELFTSTHAMMHEPNDAQFIFHKCGACASVFLVNRVAESNLENYYSTHYLPYKGAEAWGPYRKFVDSSMKKLDRKRAALILRETKNLSRPFSILDVGCGHPSFLNAVQQTGNAQCVGIDFSDHGWKQQAFDHLTLFKTTVAQFKPNQLFDVITLWHYLEHDYRIQETVEKLFACLKPGGKLIVEVPDYQSVSARSQKQFWQGWHSPRHLTLFSKKGFHIMFPNDKWTITKHHRWATLDAFTLWWLGRMERKQINWSASMAPEFWPLVFLKIATAPFFLLEKFFPMGLQLLVIKKNK